MTVKHFNGLDAAVMFTGGQEGEDSLRKVDDIHNDKLSPSLTLGGVNEFELREFSSNDLERFPMILCCERLH